jgi:AraC-like DNA-binding protein
MRPIVPASFAKLVIPGSRPHCAEGLFGKILFQEIHAAGLSFFYNIYKIQEDLALDFSIDTPACLTHIIVKNENRYDISGVGPTYLKQGQFNTMRSSSIRGTHYLEKNNEYRTISIYYPVERLQEFLPLFPFLDDFVDEAPPVIPALLFKHHSWISAKVMEVIDDLLHCPYYGSMRRLYFNYKIKELLLLTLTCKYPGIKMKNVLNEGVIESVNEAKYIIETSVSKSLSLPRIAKQVGMNEVNLSGGFRSVFGIGIVDYLQKIKEATRMKRV